MGKLLFFRVSANEYKENDIISPSDSSYSKRLDGPRNTVEDALNNAPQGGKRSDYLFLFDSLENALIYLIKHSSYNHIYLVDVDCYDVFKKCDMNFIDGMMYLVKNYSNICERGRADLLNTFAKDYWESGATEAPCNEFLVKKATVRQHIFSIDTLEHEKLEKEYNDNGRRVLELEVFKELYKKIYL